MECLTTTSREVLKELLALNEQDTDRLMYCISQVRCRIVKLNGLIHEIEISLDTEEVGKAIKSLTEEDQNYYCNILYFISDVNSPLLDIKMLIKICNNSDIIVVF